MKKRIDISCAKLELIDRQLIRIVYNDEHEIVIDNMVEIDNAILQLVPNGKIHLIIDATAKYLNMTSEVQKYFAQTSPLIKRLGSSAIVLNNLPNRILVRFYINYYKPVYPVKIFKNEAQAISWTSEIMSD